jgi:hypothetical protein
MKKLLFVLSLLLAGCLPVTPTPTDSLTGTYIPLLEAFAPSAECPNICWLGMHPGITTSEEAIKFIQSSDQFDQRATEILDDRMRTLWFPEKTKTLRTGVNIDFSKGLVKSITFGWLKPFTLQDFAGFLGPPDEMSLMVGNGVPGDKFTEYNLYYPSLKAYIQVRSDGRRGPQPDDFIELLAVNVKKQDDYRQPWVGYGHFDQYFLRAIPTPTYGGPP